MLAPGVKSRWWLLVSCAALASCDNMKHQSHSTPLDSSDQFADGTSARTPPAHTRPAGPALAAAVEEGVVNGKPISAVPLPLSQKLLERGRDQYTVYCSVCHGDDGYGGGIVVVRGFPPPPSFHDARLRSAPAGQLYRAIALGFGKMYPLADRIAVADRWAIVAYIRALQRSQHATIADVPEGERAALLRP
jgi:mono/diheme cytochrome c family protein